MEARPQSGPWPSPHDEPPSARPVPAVPSPPPTRQWGQQRPVPHDTRSEGGTTAPGPPGTSSEKAASKLSTRKRGKHTFPQSSQRFSFRIPSRHHARTLRYPEHPQSAAPGLRTGKSPAQALGKARHAARGCPGDTALPPQAFQEGQQGAGGPGIVALVKQNYIPTSIGSRRARGEL